MSFIPLSDYSMLVLLRVQLNAKVLSPLKKAAVEKDVNQLIFIKNVDKIKIWKLALSFDFHHIFEII